MCIRVSTLPFATHLAVEKNGVRLVGGDGASMGRLELRPTAWFNQVKRRNVSWIPVYDFDYFNYAQVGMRTFVNTYHSHSLRYQRFVTRLLAPCPACGLIPSAPQFMCLRLGFQDGQKVSVPGLSTLAPNEPKP